MDQRALSYLSSRILERGGYNPMGFNRRTPTYTHLADFISPVQFERWAHDIGMWRDAIREMELPYYPQRIKAMRMYIDTVENIYIRALYARWKELTLQRDIEIYQYKNGKKVVSNDLTQCLDSKPWFHDYLELTLEALWWGYTFISLGDIEKDEFPNITGVRRENVNPDGNGQGGGPILTSLIYSIDGLHITEDPLISMCNHWIPTKSDRFVSKCGYGMLYNIAYNEIHLRHVMEWNVDYVELYGQPIRKGTTSKIGKDRKQFENWLKYAASRAYILLDKGTNDDVEFIAQPNNGTSWKVYENLEKRLKNSLSQFVLGHEDAMQSTAGKLGGQQTASKDGFNVSLIEQGMIAKQITCGNFVSRRVNDTFAPNMRTLGSYIGSKKIKDYIPDGYLFGYKNDKEEDEIRRRTNVHRKSVAEYAKGLNDAGYNIDVKQLSEEVGLDLTSAPPERKSIEKKEIISKSSQKIKNSIKND